MKTILTALALVLSATAANAKTYTFDIYSPPVSVPATPAVKQGSGTISFTEQTMATAKTNQPGFSIYEPAAFDLNLKFTNYYWSDRELTIGRVNVGHQLVSYSCNITPTGCVPGNMTVSNSITVDFIGGTLNVRSPDVLSNGNLSQSNVDLLFSNATGGSMTLAQTSPYGVSNGPVYLQLSNFRALSVAAPVPEPGEWAMMGAGLAVVGGIARRRRGAK